MSVRGQRLLVVAALLLGAALASLPRAEAFKGGGDFRKRAAAGGGGGLTFTGAPAYKHWDCRICHVKAEGRIRIHLDAEPADLLTARRYTPGATYRFTVRMDGEHRGFGAARNTNGLAVTIAGAGNAAAGSIGFGADFQQGNHEAEIVTTGTTAGLTSWSFSWTAPPAGTGRATMYVAMVDGDGASDPATVLSDPFNDDVAVGSIVFDEAAAQATRLPLTGAARPGTTPAGR